MFADYGLRSSPRWPEVCRPEQYAAPNFLCDCETDDRESVNPFIAT